MPGTVIFGCLWGWSSCGSWWCLSTWHKPDNRCGEYQTCCNHKTSSTDCGQSLWACTHSEKTHHQHRANTIPALPPLFNFWPASLALLDLGLHSSSKWFLSGNLPKNMWENDQIKTGQRQCQTCALLILVVQPGASGCEQLVPALKKGWISCSTQLCYQLFEKHHHPHVASMASICHTPPECCMLEITWKKDWIRK